MIKDYKTLFDIFGITGIFVYLIWQDIKVRRKSQTNKDHTANINNLTNSYLELEEKNKEEHEKIIKVIESRNNNFKDIRKDLNDIFIILKNNQSSVDDKKRYTADIRGEIAHALPYFSDDNLKNFVIIQCEEFSQWALKSSKFIFNDIQSLDLSIQQLNTACNTLKTQCYIHLPDTLCDKYFELKSIELEKYLIRVRKIYDDRVNDKVNKFMRTSIIYMQDFISLLLSVYIDSLDYKSQKNWKKQDIDGQEDLRRLENKTNTIL